MRGRVMHSRLMGLVVIVHVMNDGNLMMSFVMMVIMVVMGVVMFFFDKDHRFFVMVSDILNDSMVVDFGVLVELMMLLHMNRLLNNIGTLLMVLMIVLVMATNWVAVVVGVGFVLNIVSLLVTAIDMAFVVVVEVMVDRMLMLLIVVFVT